MVIVEGAASVRVRQLSSGLYVNEYSGVLTLQGLHTLFDRVAHAMPDARLVLVRPRGAVMAFEGLVTLRTPAPADVVECRPAGLFAVAVVVAPECYERIRASCLPLSGLGVLSTCWVLHQHAQALQWLARCRDLSDLSAPVLRQQMLV